MDPSIIQLFVHDLDAGEWPSPQSCLSAAELRRAGRFAVPLHAQRYLRGRAAVRHVLGSLLGINAANVRMDTLANGKPVLGDAPELGFSVAHCEQHCVIATGWRRQLGVDVEMLRSLGNRDALVARHFTASERAAVCCTPADQRDRLFFQCWTRKEAWLKLSGRGLGPSLALEDVGTGNAANVGVDACIHTQQLDLHRIVSIASNHSWTALQCLSVPGPSGTLPARTGIAPGDSSAFP